MKIDKGHPIPKDRRDGTTSRIWLQMGPGDSVFFDNEPAGSQASVVQLARQFGYRNGFKFAARREGNGVRLWRVE